MRSFELENRVIDFSVSAIRLTGKLPDDFSFIHLGKQLIRSSTSAALNYGEAQSGESRRDFIHKMRICLKELRETHVCLRIINSLYAKKLAKKEIDECNELISFFVRSVKTAQSKL